MEVPLRIGRSIGSQAISKGDIAGQLRFYAWDAVPVCQGRVCPAFLSCTYELRHDVADLVAQRQNGIELELPRCGIMHNYLVSITEIIFRNYAEELTEAQLFRVGMGLIPQYRQLCKLQIEELGLDSVIYENDKGDKKLNPLLVAVRDQILAIERMWHTIGLQKVDMQDAGKRDNSYDRMNKEAQAKVKEKREGRLLKSRE